MLIFRASSKRFKC